MSASQCIHISLCKFHVLKVKITICFAALFNIGILVIVRNYTDSIDSAYTTLIVVILIPLIILVEFNMFQNSVQ